MPKTNSPTHTPAALCRESSISGDDCYGTRALKSRDLTTLHQRDVYPCDMVPRCPVSRCQVSRFQSPHAVRIVCRCTQPRDKRGPESIVQQWLDGAPACVFCYQSIETTSESSVDRTGRVVTCQLLTTSSERADRCRPAGHGRRAYPTRRWRPYENYRRRPTDPTVDVRKSIITVLCVFFVYTCRSVLIFSCNFFVFFSAPIRNCRRGSALLCSAFFVFVVF